MDFSSTKFFGHSRKCATLLETIIAMMIFSFFLAAMYRTISYSSASAQKVSQRLYLQMEARKAILDLYSRIQEGIELILPAPGGTLSHLSLRDLHSNIHVIYLKKNEAFSKSEGEDRFDVIMATTKPDATGKPEERTILRHVKKMTFTAHDYSGVLVKITLSNAGGRFSVINFIHLKNRGALDL